MTDNDVKRLFRLGTVPYLVLRRGFNSDETYEAEIQRLLDLGATEEPYPHAEPTKRFVVGRWGDGGFLGEFDTLDEVSTFQATLPQDELHAGAFYIDDMEDPER